MTGGRQEWKSCHSLGRRFALSSHPGDKDRSLRSSAPGGRPARAHRCLGNPRVSAPSSPAGKPISKQPQAPDRRHELWPRGAGGNHKAVARRELELKHASTLRASPVRRGSAHSASLYLKFKTQLRSALLRDPSTVVTPGRKAGAESHGSGDFQQREGLCMAGNFWNPGHVLSPDLSGHGTGVRLIFICKTTNRLLCCLGAFIIIFFYF